MNSEQACPICDKMCASNAIEQHVERCLFLCSTDSPSTKKMKCEARTSCSQKDTKDATPNEKSFPNTVENVPLAEQVRPKILEEYVGQMHILGENTFLRQLIVNKNIPSMIFWGPPGCGKTSLANLISHICNDNNNLRFVKLSATMSGINDVKEIVKIAKNEVKFKRKTVLFMDEIHRFNKLQQDTFLPHIEDGTIILIGATTQNPSFSLNSALLSRCRVIVFNKLSSDDIMIILTRALTQKYNGNIVDNTNKKYIQADCSMILEKETLQWLADVSDGDARIALNSLQIVYETKKATLGNRLKNAIVSLEDIQDGIKRSHLLYDRKGEEHYNTISALHKSIRASDDNAALYWLTRMLEAGEDPLYIARRLVRVAGEDIGIVDPQALTLAVSCMEGCQLIGMPECDVLLAECAVYLARAKKSTEIYRSLQKCKKCIAQHKGALPSVPLHLRNAPTKLMSELGYGKGYNTLQKEKSNLTYMPEGMEKIKFFE